MLYKVGTPFLSFGSANGVSIATGGNPAPIQICSTVGRPLQNGDRFYLSGAQGLPGAPATIHDTPNRGSKVAVQRRLA